MMMIMMMMMMMTMLMTMMLFAIFIPKDLKCNWHQGDWGEGKKLWGVEDDNGIDDDDDEYAADDNSDDDAKFSQD